jgi:hypothetical protein
MPVNEETGKHELVRAVPDPKNARFFISHRGVPKISKNYESVRLDEVFSGEIKFTDLTSRHLRVTAVNKYNSVGDQCILNQPFAAIPRIDGRYPPDIDKTFVVWSLDNSIFKDMQVRD